MKECPSCALEYEGTPETCPYCGYEFPQQKSSLKMVAWLLIALMLVFILWAF